MPGKHSNTTPAHARMADAAVFEDEATEPSTGKSKRKAIIILLAALAIALIVGGVFLVNKMHQDELNRQAQEAADQAQEEPEPEPQEESEPEEEPEVVLPDNPIDFTELKAQNPDIYAWITIPGTKVDYPIVQSVVDDNYYLRRDYLGNDYLYGAIYTQSANATDFSDPVTVIYGHYAENDEQFATLHYFENDDFFDEYDTIYIYIPGHILTYQVVAAYQYDDRHILNSFDFSNAEVLQTYYDSVLDPNSMLENVRDGAVLTTDDKIVQLSTCMSSYIVASTRYIVTGVLTDDQQTN